MSHKLLIVDDEPEITEEISEYLTGKGYDCATALNVGEALRVLNDDDDIAIVIADIKMPGRDGLDLLEEAKNSYNRDIEVIIITGHGGTDEAVSALRLGALDYLKKPVDLRHLLHVVQRADELLFLKMSDKLLSSQLEVERDAKSAKVNLLMYDVQEAYEEALEALAVAAEFRDPETGNHIRRVSEYAKKIAAELGLDPDKCDQIGLAAPLHDVGKIGTPESILLKKGRLTYEEFENMKHHSTVGHSILAGSKFPIMKTAAEIAHGHHERWDGSGYPRGIHGLEIPPEARITSLADVYDALRSSRPYKGSFSHDEAAATILEGDGRTDPNHFDPEVLEVFRKSGDSFGQIFDRHGSEDEQ